MKPASASAWFLNPPCGITSGSRSSSSSGERERYRCSCCPGLEASDRAGDALLERALGAGLGVSYVSETRKLEELGL